MGMPVGDYLGSEGFSADLTQTDIAAFLAFGAGGRLEQRLRVRCAMKKSSLNGLLSIRTGILDL